MFCLPDCDSTVDDILVEAPVMGDENPNFYIGDTGGVTYHTAGGDDIVYAEEGDDTIYGGAGDDRLFGGEGDPTRSTEAQATTPSRATRATTRSPAVPGTTPSPAAVGPTPLFSIQAMGNDTITDFDRTGRTPSISPPSPR